MVVYSSLQLYFEDFFFWMCITWKITGNNGKQAQQHFSKHVLSDEAL